MNTHTEAALSEQKSSGSWVRINVTKEVEVWVSGSVPKTRMELLDVFNSHRNSQKIKAVELDVLP
jgi:hypothetical protein